MAEYLKTGKNKKFCCDKVDGGEFCTLLSRIESWEEVESRQPDGHGGDGGDGKLSDLLDGAKRISVEF